MGKWDLFWDSVRTNLENPMNLINSAKSRIRLASREIQHSAKTDAKIPEEEHELLRAMNKYRIDLVLKEFEKMCSEFNYIMAHDGRAIIDLMQLTSEEIKKIKELHEESRQTILTINLGEGSIAGVPPKINGQEYIKEFVDELDKFESITAEVMQTIASFESLSIQLQDKPSITSELVHRLDPFNFRATIKKVQKLEKAIDRNMKSLNEPYEKFKKNNQDIPSQTRLDLYRSMKQKIVQIQARTEQLKNQLKDLRKQLKASMDLIIHHMQLTETDENKLKQHLSQLNQRKFPEHELDKLNKTFQEMQSRFKKELKKLLSDANAINKAADEAKSRAKG